ncbi:MAG: hypothetical protein CNIPEHKO_00609 [Anaerolineales bacterium]|nr:hypothetical protein [Anaerolineae bacterium]MBL8107096.1 hypothetical protein [Anaerolineales bacterium]MBV6400324.1 hypothetical protein [Anaerolineales bacterium]MCC7189129.1 hypothetical protein [Anaerolineales bacterium]HQU35836.1 hypothetical protein [Anaerolineales bacterium]
MKPTFKWDDPFLLDDQLTDAHVESNGKKIIHGKISIYPARSIHLGSKENE